MKNLTAYLAALILLGCGGGGSDDGGGGDGGSGGSSSSGSGGSGSSTELTSDFTPPTGAATGPGNWGPWNARLMIATSADGLTFTRTNVVVTDQGDVPDLVIDASGRIFLYYVCWSYGPIVVAISDDDGASWVYKYVTLSGFSGYASPVDPDVQILPDGTFRLYVTSDPNDGQGARTYCAESSDGFTFVNLGVAFEQPGQMVLDPTTYSANGTWHLYAGGGTSVPESNFHGTSTDGLTFAAQAEQDFLYEGMSCAVSNAIEVPGGWRFYGFVHGTAPNIVSFFSADGDAWTADPGYRLVLDTSAGLESTGVKDPAVVRLADGSYLMAYVTRIP